MKFGRNVVLYLSFAFLIIGAHQTITLGFEVSYWIFMITISLYLLYRLMGQTDSAKGSDSKGKSIKGSKFIKKSKTTGTSTANKSEPTTSKRGGIFGFLRGAGGSKNQPKLNRRAKRYMEKTQGTNG